MTGPNLEEIEMSLDMHYLTEIVITDKPRDGIVNTWSRGRSKPGVSPYSRPMIQIMETTSAEHRDDPQVPCADCGDFSRSWNCEAHTYWGLMTDDTPEPSFRTAYRAVQGYQEQARRYHLWAEMPSQQAFMMNIPAMAPGRVVSGTSVDGRTIHIEEGSRDAD